jgi:hypothetical protein
VQCCTLASLGDAAPSAAPSVLIAGWAVREASSRTEGLLLRELAAESSASI